MISCKDIKKNYGDSKILNGIDAKIKRGQITVLIGPSGSGKTTLLKSLSLIENPSSGTINLDGVLFEFPQKKIKIRRHFFFDGEQTVGIVFQNLDLIPHWTNRQNILNPIRLKTSESEIAELKDLIELFKMGGFIDKLPHQCSRGEQQRVAFVRAVMLKPKYLFLDEITSALDPELIVTLFRYLIKLKNKGTGILIITHFLLFAQNVADRIIFLSGGKVFEQGPREIMISPGTKKLQDYLLSLGGIILNTQNPKVRDITTSVLGMDDNVIEEFYGSNDVNRKMRLVYRVLDQDGLTEEQLEDVYQFVKTNFSTFKLDLEKWLSISNEDDCNWDILDDYIQERLSNPKYPKHKLWIYLLSYKTAQEWKSKDLREILNKYKNPKYPIRNIVVTEMINELI